MQTAIMIMALTGLAAALRGSYLTARSLWFDEAWSVWLAQMPVDRMLATLRWLDAHPPLYYLLLRAWILGLGDSETSVRFLSVAVGSLTVTLTYVVATRWCDRTVAAVAAFFVAISPLHVMATSRSGSALVGGHQSWWWASRAVFFTLLIDSPFIVILWLL